MLQLRKLTPVKLEFVYTTQLSPSLTCNLMRASLWVQLKDKYVTAEEFLRKWQKSRNTIKIHHRLISRANLLVIIVKLYNWCFQFIFAELGLSGTQLLFMRTEQP